VNLLLGLWLLVARWALGFAGVPRAAWDHWVVGLLVAALAAWTLSRLRRESPGTRRPP